MQLDILPFDLPLANPFRISHESRTVQPTIIVRLSDAKGRSGLGEAPQTRYYGLETKRSIGELKKIKAWLPSSGLDSMKSAFPLPHRLHEELDEHFSQLHPFLRCALDVAAHDLWAKQRGRPLYQLWDSNDPERRIPSCYTIGMGPVEEMVEKISAFPWPIYKIKLGPEHGPATIRRLREVTSSTFRVDANTGWTAEQTLAYAPELRDLGVEFIEQPLPVDNIEGQRKLYAQSVLPIMADESCQTEGDVDRCAGLFHGINIKVVKCGGLLPARRMIKNARAAGLQLMAGCMTESSVGISAIAQLVPELDYVDIDGALLLKEEPAEGVSFNQEGIVQFTGRAGTGARLL